MATLRHLSLLSKPADTFVVLFEPCYKIMVGKLKQRIEVCLWFSMWQSQLLSWFVFGIHFKILVSWTSPLPWQVASRYSLQVQSEPRALCCSTNLHCGGILAGLSSWGKGDNHDFLLTGVWHYVSRRLRQMLLWVELPGWPCYSDCLGRSLGL